MCYQKLHYCKYCHHYYPCALKDFVCPSLNDDADKNMCDECREKERIAFIEQMEKDENG